MRAVVQRVTQARVVVAEEVVGELARGLCVLLGVVRGDEPEDAERLAGRVARLRVFENVDGKFDYSLVDMGGAALVVSQFTLIADTEKGNRPSFSEGAEPDVAERLYGHFCASLGAHGVPVETGVFGARMRLDLANSGPVTIILGT